MPKPCKQLDSGENKPPTLPSWVHSGNTTPTRTVSPFFVR
jgi:hypothetical protein